MYDVNKVINIASNEVGYLEKKSNSQLDSKTANAGSNNYTKYGRDMHKLFPAYMDFPAYWCLCFVSWCFYNAYGLEQGAKLLCGQYDDYTIAMAQRFKTAGKYNKIPKVGDLVFFKNAACTKICHVGLVYKVTGTYIYTIEGNTSGASGVVANGGGVAKKSYKRSYYRIDGYAHPDYSNNGTSVVVNSNPITKNYLSIGDKGSAVVSLQQKLIALGYSCGKSGADGDFGKNTDSAVRKFQSVHGLVVDGKAGEKTMAKLNELYNAKSKPSTGNNWVSRLQATCNSLGYSKQVVDGIPGKNTLAGCPTLKKGSKGAVVRLLQEKLISLGYSCGKFGVDGDFGSSTKSDVKAYQKSKGLKQDGIVGKNTWKKLLGL